MTKPDDIPQDVWDKAILYSGAYTEPAGDTLSELRYDFARAIMAAKAEEREACAEHLIAVAKATPLGHENQQRGKSTYNWLVHCAGLIRKRGEEE